MSQEVLIDRGDDGLVTLTLHRPARRNALGRDLVGALSDHLDALRRDPSARAIVVRGAGERAFCAGADLKERRTMAPAEVRRFVDKLRATMSALAAMPKPTIAAINGFALGGGCELALACDLRVMAQGATIGLPETHLGIIPGAGGTQRLARLIGPARAKELVFSGRRLGADEALSIGLINRSAAPADRAIGPGCCQYIRGNEALRILCVRCRGL